MLLFLRSLVAYLAAQGVLEPEVTEDGPGRTFLQQLPDTPIDANGLICYDSKLPTLTDKQSGVYHIQVIFRRSTHAAALQAAITLFQFLCSRPEPIEDLEEGRYAIFDVRSGPVSLGSDENGNWRYSLNFPVTSQMYI